MSYFARIEWSGGEPFNLVGFEDGVDALALAREVAQHVPSETVRIGIARVGDEDYEEIEDWRNGSPVDPQEWIAEQMRLFKGDPT